MIKTCVSHLLRLPSVPPDLHPEPSPGIPSGSRIDALTTCPACRNRIDGRTRYRRRRHHSLANNRVGGASQRQRKRTTLLQSSDEETRRTAIRRHLHHLPFEETSTSVVDIPPATDLPSIKESAPKSRFFKVCGSDRGFWVRQITPGSISKIGTTTGLERFRPLHRSPLSSRSEKKTYLLLYLRFRVHGTTNAITTKSRSEAPHGGCRQRCPAIAEVVVVMAVSKPTQQRQRGPRASRDRPTSRTKLPLNDRHPDGRVVDAQRLQSAGKGRESETCRCVLSTKRTTFSAHHHRGRP